MIITYAQLKANTPCEDQFKVYLENFPDNNEVTEESLLKATRLDLDLYWFANNFLPAPARKAYLEAIALEWKAFEVATAPAWDAYEEATALALWRVIKEFKL